MMPKPLTPIRFGVLEDDGLRAPEILGAFSHGQLVCAKTSDGTGNILTWKRQPGESAEAFEKRIVAELREMLTTPP